MYIYSSKDYLFTMLPSLFTENGVLLLAIFSSVALLLIAPRWVGQRLGVPLFVILIMHASFSSFFFSLFIFFEVSVSLVEITQTLS